MKKERREKIIELIGKYQIETQDELAEKLEEAGFQVTQATVSRDIRELKLTKVSVDGVHQKYTHLQEKETDLSYKYIRVLQDGFLSMDPAENLLVIKTLSGMAMAVAAALDDLEVPGIVGSIAGDDTVMCAVRSVGEVPQVMSKITKLLNTQSRSEDGKMDR
ncbi:MAG: arginine repressor [Lachnospiraceae bacterium]|nr:arginine repressor [Lachnospiraceae bacterium]